MDARLGVRPPRWREEQLEGRQATRLTLLCCSLGAAALLIPSAAPHADSSRPADPTWGAALEAFAEADACSFGRGKRSDGVLVSSAECAWARSCGDISAVLRDANDWSSIFSLLADARMLADDTVFHRYRVRPTKDRVAVVNYTEGTDAAGNWWLSWRIAPDRPMPSGAEGGVPAMVVEGYWYCQPGPTASLSYRLAYDPGGDYPGWIRRAAQDRVTERFLSDLKDYLDR